MGLWGTFFQGGLKEGLGLVVALANGVVPWGGKPVQKLFLLKLPYWVGNHWGFSRKGLRILNY